MCQTVWWPPLSLCTGSEGACETENLELGEQDGLKTGLNHIWSCFTALPTMLSDQTIRDLALSQDPHGLS